MHLQFVVTLMKQCNLTLFIFVSLLQSLIFFCHMSLSLSNKIHYGSSKKPCYTVILYGTHNYRVKWVTGNMNRFHFSSLNLIRSTILAEIYKTNFSVSVKWRTTEKVQFQFLNSFSFVLTQFSFWEED